MPDHDIPPDCSRVVSFLLTSAMIGLILLLILTALHILSVKIPAYHQLHSEHFSIASRQPCLVPASSRRSIRSDFRLEKRSGLLLCGKKHKVTPAIMLPQYATAGNSKISFNILRSGFSQWSRKSVCSYPSPAGSKFRNRDGPTV